METKYFEIVYGCGCGDVTEFIEAENYDEAMEIAYHWAYEDYESYAGYHGVLSLEDIMRDLFGEEAEWDELSDEQVAEVEDAYYEEIENTIYYSAKELSYEDWKEERKNYGY